MLFLKGVLLFLGLIEPHYELCMDCTSKKLTDGTLCMHNWPKIVVYMDVVNRKFVEIRFPRNWRGMMDKRYVFWHTYFNCSYIPNRSQCHFPHDKVEEVLWNAWKDKYSGAMEQVEHTPVSFRDLKNYQTRSCSCTVKIQKEYTNVLKLHLYVICTHQLRR